MVVSPDAIEQYHAQHVVVVMLARRRLCGMRLWLGLYAVLLMAVPRTAARITMNWVLDPIALISPNEMFATRIGGVVPAQAVLNLACPSNNIISTIKFASWGRPSGQFPDFVRTNCSATNSSAIASAACVGSASCALNASAAVFGDPCPGEAKQLAVLALCSPLIGSAASEENTAHLQCPGSQLMSVITFASFGRPSGSFPNYQTTSCASSSSHQVVAASCLGRNSCSVLSNIGVFGDPCSGLGKWLYIVALCTDLVFA